MDRKMSPRYSQEMMVSVYSSLTAVKQPSLEWRIFELTDYECKTYHFWMGHGSGPWIKQAEVSFCFVPFT